MVEIPVYEGKNMDIKLELAEIVGKALDGKFDKEFIANLITIPPEEKLGDYALPCFKLMDKTIPEISNPQSHCLPLCRALIC